MGGASIFATPPIAYTAHSSTKQEKSPVTQQNLSILVCQQSCGEAQISSKPPHAKDMAYNVLTNIS